MDSVSSRELKNQTGEILGRVRDGNRITVTNRGKPVAIIIPYSESNLLGRHDVRKYENAWPEIESAIAETQAQYGSWREAIDHSRRRK